MKIYVDNPGMSWSNKLVWIKEDDGTWHVIDNGRVSTRKNAKVNPEACPFEWDELVYSDE